MAAVALLVMLGKDVPPPLARGATVPDFSLPRQPDGEPVSLSALRGRVVLVNFWATWCEPCEAEMPSMDRLYRALHPLGFDLLAISVDDDVAEIEKFQERFAITFPILHDPDELVSGDYQTTGYPESILVDRDGRMVERYVGPRDWDADIYADRIRRLLAAQGP